MSITVGGPFVVSTVVAETPTETFARNQARLREISQNPLDFLGNGLLSPLRRGSRDFNSAAGVDLIRASVRQVLGTRAAAGEDRVGELAWRPDFGSKFWLLKHRNNDGSLEGLAIAFAFEALAWGPRVEVTEVQIINTQDPNELNIRVLYRIIDENVSNNSVFLPEEFEEVVPLAS